MPRTTIDDIKTGTLIGERAGMYSANVEPEIIQISMIKKIKQNKDGFTLLYLQPLWRADGYSEVSKYSFNHISNLVDECNDERGGYTIIAS